MLFLVFLFRYCIRSPWLLSTPETAFPNLYAMPFLSRPTDPTARCTFPNMAFGHSGTDLIKAYELLSTHSFTFHLLPSLHFRPSFDFQLR